MKDRIEAIDAKLEHWIEFLDTLAHFPLARKAKKDLHEIRDFLQEILTTQEESV